MIVSGDQERVLIECIEAEDQKDNKLEAVVQSLVVCLDQEGGRQVG